MAENKTFTPLPDLPPPASTVGFVGWLRSNLFSSPANTIMTVLAAVFALWLIPPTLDWTLFSAVYSGGSEACAANPDAACWPFITKRLPQFFYGFYEETERWRVDVAAIMLAVGLVWLLIERLPYRQFVGLFMLLVYPLIAWALLYGSVFGIDFFPIVQTSLWGGFSLTLVIALTGIVISLPLGIVFALGRQSKMPIIRTICISFIEFWRGVPLITVLFMASVMLPLFLPEGVTFDQLLRALLGVALFSSAYMAEVVRGGLQAIPKGQTEGAQSLGLGYWLMMRKIILPQALKTVIPGIVNTFIGLFKDTTLVLIISLFDLLGVVQAAIADPNWSVKSVPYTGYVFVALVFWVCCFGMSQYSRYVERKLHTGHKR
ncbi:amino acid ABC transporter permease [Kiloniella sp. b19]|uniref:amino acid ABC transporter permease n=1 Tax=Kiloniella sp. GXU_MW_B19 TaxID=3141326 RepID=UPI0031DFA8C4